MDIEEEFLNRTTDRANRLVAKLFYYANFVCLVFLIARKFSFFNMSYRFTLITWAIVLFFSVSLFLLIRFSFNRTFVMYLGLLGVVTIISFMGANYTVGINISYAFATLFGCLYLVKRYTIASASLGYIGLTISLFIRSKYLYLNDNTCNTPLSYFIPSLAGYTLEYIGLLLMCVLITKILRQTVFELQERNSRIRKLQTKELQTFADIVECRDKFSGEHIKRTSKYVELLARELSATEKFKNILTTDVINCIIEAAPLHDLGKIQIPDNILKKEGKLTKEEFEVMKTHAEIGYNMIGAYLPEIVDDELLMYSEMMALYHHEHYDGNGYPKGISGEAIPLCARIMTVADVLDALLSRRHYKDSFTLDEAIEIMKNETGKTFDPDIIQCLLKIIPKIKEISRQSEDLEEIEEI